MSDSFQIYMPLQTWIKSGDEHELRIGGIVSTDGLDRQGEKVVQDGLDFSPFLSHGWFNDNHGQKTGDVLGYPTEVKRIAKGDHLPNGAVSSHNGWWAEGYLLGTDDGRKIYDLATSLSTSNDRRLGFSIEGKVTRRDNKDKSKIVSAVVNNVAVTHCPVNTDTHLQALAKALSAGHSVESPGTSAGEGFALRTESLDKKKKKKKGEEEVELHNLSYDEDGGEPNNGGFGGTSPHVKKAGTEENLTPRTTWEYLAGWENALNDFPTDNRPVMLSKAEAEIIVSSTHPKLSAEQVESIVGNAAGRKSG
jgi:hypothetical protein